MGEESPWRPSNETFSLKDNSKISAQELKEVGRDELTGVNLGQVDPATLQATKIACGAHMCGLVR